MLCEFRKNEFCKNEFHQYVKIRYVNMEKVRDRDKQKERRLSVLCLYNKPNKVTYPNNAYMGK